MRPIQKGPEPSALRQYRAVPGATYDGKDFTPVKNEIRDQLLKDQFSLCCYCMGRISSESRPHRGKPHLPPVVQMKVEHWQSQEHHPERQLDWKNLLGACLGNEGSPGSAQTCDSRKGEEVIVLNPQDESHMKTLRCLSTGRLESTDPRFQADIDERLGLNHPILMKERRVALDRALVRLQARHPKSQIPEAEVRSLVNELETPIDGKLPPFGCVLRLWARKRFGDHW